MFAIIYLLGTFVADLLKSRRQHYPETTTADFFDSIDPQQNLDWQVAAFSAYRSWADCTINTSGFDFR